MGVERTPTFPCGKTFRSHNTIDEDGIVPSVRTVADASGGRLEETRAEPSASAFRRLEDHMSPSPETAQYLAENEAESFEAENPFAAFGTDTEWEDAPSDPRASESFLAWTEASTPFSETESFDGNEAEQNQLAMEVIGELRDEGFDEALAELVSETEHAVEERFDREQPGQYGAERERLASAHLSGVGMEAELYLERLEQGLAGIDTQSLDEQQLDEVLESFDPESASLTPAGEEFLGGLIRKARNAVKVVARTASRVGSAVAGSAIGFVLRKLKGLIQPLLKRVLAFAIGRLPAPLRPAATALASKLKLEAEGEMELEEFTATPATATDTQALAESFDEAVAEAVTSAAQGQEQESFAEREYQEYESEGVGDGRELETLVEARAQLINTLRNAQEGEDLTPAIEQFVPALLGALRIGISVVGRKKVVNFLAGYLAKLIGKWTGPKLAQPLSAAIVDAGLKLITLEQSTELERADEAAPTVLAATIEDTVRRFAENEEYVYEDEDLLQLAAAEAFDYAVASNFPPRLVRTGLRQAATLDGSFVSRRIRSTHPYRKYSQIPEVELTQQIADALRSFGGTTIGAQIRAAGVTLPIRVRVHLYQATAGTTLPHLAAFERTVLGNHGIRRSWEKFHPLTVEAAGLLLREPGLGVAAPDRYLDSRHRIAAGQRFYYLEPVGRAVSLSPVAVAPGYSGARAATSNLRTTAPIGTTSSTVLLDLRGSNITVRLHISEADAQTLTKAIGAGHGRPAALALFAGAFRGIRLSTRHLSSRFTVQRESGESEEFAAAPLRRLQPGVLSMVHRRVRAWLMHALATWTRTRLQEFVRAANDPANGVTVTVILRGVPGLPLVRNAIHGHLSPEALRSLLSGTAFRGSPAAEVHVEPGMRG